VLVLSTSANLFYGYINISNHFKGHFQVYVSWLADPKNSKEIYEELWGILEQLTALKYWR